ncbi:fatty acid cis/trans isomerase [Luminiphilus syltensis NOR5-1B]|uniref:Fatty acid cis/trans isomerase n=1 Tax=Luminiphilus syltensis NOR5-1B TaxID=565045 RepID=B8KVG1_9GAMM|nr:fatty acid cis/trans isomerase [Luminiphilus syltensis NOR5-1B]
MQGFPAEIKPIVEQRCVVCHGCYDAPCQLKLDAWPGLERGASKSKVYDGTRLRPAELTRLFEDAHSIEEWRSKGFYPVLDDNDPTQGTMFKMLQLKQDFPLPRKGRLPDTFDFSLDRDQSCPKPDEFSGYREQRPYQGMPFGFPGLDDERLDTLTRWLKAGAPGVSVPAVPDSERATVRNWEQFLNAPDNKTRLMSRYVYEHLFIGDLHFDTLEQPSGWYKLVRSRTPPGEPVDLIASRRPYDDPGVEHFYYRLQLRHMTRLAKRHMPYALNPARQARWTALFLEPDYSVDTLPGYGEKTTSNPFITFQQLPVDTRYRFMLDEAHFTIMAYIKGPVCRGQVALNVIDDHFWVAFVQPDQRDPDQQASFLASQADRMRLPQAKKSLLMTALRWRSYAKSQRRYLEARAEAIAKVVDADQIKLDMDLIWNGGAEQNENAALTVFRHFDSASVVKGFVGQQPKTMWVIDYSLLERIHYLLVADFDVYGAVGHQLESRLYMDFLRMEGEQGFLMLLPKADRDALRNYWYRGAESEARAYILSPRHGEFERESDIAFSSDDTKAELMGLFENHIPAADASRYAVTESSLLSLMEGPSSVFHYLPQTSFVQVLKPDGARETYTLLTNSAHSNIAQLFAEEERRLPEEDTLTVARGFIGAYPNMFFQITQGQLEAFAQAIQNLDSDDDYQRFLERYGERRTVPWFWKLSDDLYEEYRRAQPIEAGLFDLNRYENR